MAETPKQEPNAHFVTSAERVVEGNWEWLRAEGFHPHETFTETQRLEYKRWKAYADRFGVDNVREGDVYDPASARPLRHIPGMTVYVRVPPADRHKSSDEAGA
jgi:hypothetical protein